MTKYDSHFGCASEPVRYDAWRYVTQHYDPRDAEEVARCRASYDECVEEAEDNCRFYNVEPPPGSISILARLIACADIEASSYGANPTHEPVESRETWLMLGRLVAVGLIDIAWNVRPNWYTTSHHHHAMLAWLNAPASYTRKYALRENGGSHTKQEWKILLRAFDHRCARYGAPDEYAPLCEDHITPVVSGGSDDISNIQPLCRSCNSSKGMDTTDYRPAALARLHKSEVQP